MTAKTLNVDDMAAAPCESIEMGLTCPRCGGVWHVTDDIVSLCDDQVIRCKMRCATVKCQAHFVMTTTLRFDRALDEGHKVG